MRLLPRIIKSQNLFVTDPVIINPMIKDTSPLVFAPLGKTIAEQSKEMFTKDSDAFDSMLVREEADKILQETEQMVMEILEKARNEANNIITEAMELAEEQKIQATAESEAVKQNALDAGYQEGSEKAQNEIASEKERGLTESQRLIDQALFERADILKASEEIIIRLSLAVAKKIVEREIQQDPGIVVDLVKNIVELLSDADSIKVLVNPIDYERLVNNQYSITAPGQGIGSVELVSDERITPGGCIAESELGSIDGRLETRIDNLQSALTEAAGGE